MKAAIYTRVSTEEQARDGVSLAGFVLIFLFAPTVSTYRLVAFITCMFGRFWRPGRDWQRRSRSPVNPLISAILEPDEEIIRAMNQAPEDS